MIDTWFTSDLHLGHKKVIELEKEARPFNDVDEMNEKLIQNWNSVVKPTDKIYVLGDFAFGKKYVEMAARLNGKKRLVMGNHDNYPIALYAQYFERIYGVKYWNGCILTHVPVHNTETCGRAELNIHGHLHNRFVLARNSTWMKDPNYFNVSVERHNLTPVHADIILKHIKDHEE